MIKMLSVYNPRYINNSSHCIAVDIVLYMKRPKKDKKRLGMGQT